MRDFDNKINDRTRPQEFMKWLDEKLEELDKISPEEEKDSQKWMRFVNKMMWNPYQSDSCITETELKERFFGGKDNAKLQTQDDKSGEFLL